jgi:hypothetical protein
MAVGPPGLVEESQRDVPCPGGSTWGVAAALAGSVLRLVHPSSSGAHVPLRLAPADRAPLRRRADRGKRRPQLRGRPLSFSNTVRN